MIINGPGISTDYNVNILPDFRPETRLAIKWHQASDGNYFAIDRTAAEDKYLSTIRVYGTKAVIDALIDEIQANRATDSHVIALSGFNATEQLFGMDIDYTGSINSTVLEIQPISQNTLRGFSVSMTLSALSPSFTGSPSLPTFKRLDVGFKSDSSWTFIKHKSYENNFTYQDKLADAGEFEGTFLFDDDEMKALRRYIATQRGASISISDVSGVDELFASRRGGTYPYSVKVIDWQDLGRYTVNRWKMRIKFAEVI